MSNEVVPGQANTTAISCITCNKITNEKESNWMKFVEILSYYTYLSLTNSNSFTRNIMLKLMVSELTTHTFAK